MFVMSSFSAPEARPLLLVVLIAGVKEHAILLKLMTHALDPLSVRPPFGPTLTCLTQAP